MRFYGDIQRVDEEQRMVCGYASTMQRAMDGQTITREAMEAALADYMAFANIREMHQSSAAGVTREAHVDDGGLYIDAYVVDDQAWKKVVERVYKGFSIGAKVTARDAVDRTIITGISIYEISLVDRPSDPGAVFDVFRVDGADSDDDIPIEENDMARAAARTAAAVAAPEAAETPAEGVERAAEGAESPAEADEQPAEDAEAAAPAAEASDAEAAAVVEAEPEADPVARAVEAAEAASAGLGAAVEAVERAASGDEPPAAIMVLDTRPGAEIRRSMDTVSRLGYLLGELAYVIASAQYEAEYEGDNSPVPEKLRDGLKILAAGFKAMSIEEVDELLASVSATAGVEGAIILYAASGADLERAADVSLSAEQTARLQTALDGFIGRGFTPVLAEADETDLQRQVTTLTADKDRLLTTVDGLSTKMTELSDRVQRFADAPAPPKTGGALARGVDKGEDASGTPVEAAAAAITAEDVQRVLANMPEDERAMLLTRAALARPLPITHGR